MITARGCSAPRNRQPSRTVPSYKLAAATGIRVVTRGDSTTRTSMCGRFQTVGVVRQTVAMAALAVAAATVAAHEAGPGGI
eukprot:COSAG06_NODE_58853_length_276_cov_0.564972_1_plen_80_part_01